MPYVRRAPGAPAPTPAPGTPGAPTTPAPPAPSVPAAPAHHGPGAVRRFVELVLAFMTIPIVMLTVFFFYVSRNNKTQQIIVIAVAVGLALGFLYWAWTTYRKERHEVDHPVAPAPPVDPSVAGQYTDGFGHQWRWQAGATTWERWDPHSSAWV